MRRIEIIADVHARFAGRDETFDLGFELGTLAVLMAQGEPAIRRVVSAECLDQLRPLAERFGYGVVAVPAGADFALVLDIHRQGRPKLRLVQSS